MNSLRNRSWLSLGLLSLALVSISFTTSLSMREGPFPKRERVEARGEADALSISGLAPIPLATVIEQGRKLIGERRHQEAQKVILDRLAAAQDARVEDPDSELFLFALVVQTVYYGGGTLSDALLDRHVGRLEAAFGGGSPRFAQTLLVRANLLIFEGRYEDARMLTERALAIQEQALGPTHPDNAESLSRLASIAGLQGRFSQAVVYARRLVQLLERQPGSASGELAGALRDLSSIYRKMGDYENARIAAERSVKIAEQVYGPEHNWVAFGLDVLADVSRDIGDFKTARSASERAVRIWESTPGFADPTLGGGLEGLALALAELGEHSRAKELAESGLHMAEETLGPEDRRIAWFLSRVAEVRASVGDFEGARQAYRRSRTIQERFLGAEHPGVGASLIQLATLQLYLGEPEGALEDALKGERLVRNQFLDVAGVLSEKAALLYESNRLSGLRVAGSVLTRLSDSPGRSESVSRFWDEIVRSRALVLTEMAGRNHLIAAHDNPRLTQLASSLVITRNKLSALVVRGAGSSTPGTFEDTLAALKAEREALEQTIAEESSDSRSLRELVATGLPEVIAALPGETALLSFVSYNRIAPSRAGRNTDTSLPEGTPSYLALVHHAKQGNSAIIDLGPAARIDAAVRAWSEQAASPPEDIAPVGGRLELAYRHAGYSLRKLIWDPIASSVRGARNVFVVPDGSIALVSLATLPATGGGYLLESGPRFHYLVTERDLVSRTQSPRSGAGILAIGGPDFDAEPAGIATARSPFTRQAPARKADSTGSPPQVLLRSAAASCEGFQTLQFEPLPGAAEEAREIKALWTSRGGPSAGLPGSDPRLLTGKEAAETLFKQIAPSFAVLHLATHGYFMGDRCNSILSSNPAKSNPLAAISDDPLLLSGLALSGANRRADAGEDADDGILTAEEIESLDLSGVEWVVLSACETGIGRIQAGEGVLGLRRAFESAGAGTVIMSLWNVEDESTREWMRYLYEGRLQGMSTVEAVHHASQSVLDARRAKGRSTHPFYWGAFSAAGDWR